MINDELSAKVAELRDGISCETCHRPAPSCTSKNTPENCEGHVSRKYATDMNCAMELFNEMCEASSGFSVLVCENTDSGSVFACTVAIPGLGVARSTSTASASVAICQTYIKVNGMLKCTRM